MLTPITNETLKKLRKDTLAYNSNKKKGAPPLVLVLATKYNPFFNNLGKCIKKHWHVITDDIHVISVFPKPPVIAYRKHKNLKEYLTSAKL